MSTPSPVLGEELAQALFERIAHGDEKHRAWLKAELETALPEILAAKSYGPRAVAAEIADDYGEWSYWGQDNNLHIACRAAAEIAQAIRLGRPLTTDEIKAVDGAFKANPRDAVPDGFVLVPREPTPERLVAGSNAYWERNGEINNSPTKGDTIGAYEELAAAYRAMTAAAKPPNTASARDAVIELCAKVADGFVQKGRDPIGPLHAAGWNGASNHIAAAIRALKSNPIQDQEGTT